jgi:predicted site-specific integrase-resolvase
MQTPNATVVGDPTRPWVRSTEACRHLSVTGKTLARWAKAGYIHSILLPGGGNREHRLYDIGSVATQRTRQSTTTEEAEGHEPKPILRDAAVYARVSTRKQAADLERQIQGLQDRHPSATVYNDIASGINFHRRKLQRLLEDAFAGRVHTVYIAHKDRLCRFAYDLIEFVLRQCGSHVVVDSHNGNTTTTPNEELAMDLLSIVTVFGARVYGSRSHGGGRKRRREATQDRDNAACPV